MQRQHFVISAFAAFMLMLVMVNAQQYPPRLSIPGAVPVPETRPQFRNPDKFVRVRRPIALRTQQNTLATSVLAPRILEEKPVTEAPDDVLPDVFLPQLLREQQLAQAQQAQFQQTAAAFFNGEPNTISDNSHGIHLLHQEESREESPPPPPPPTRILERVRPAFNDYGIGSGFSSGQRFQSQPTAVPQQQQQPQQQQSVSPQRVNVIRTRPSASPRSESQRPQYEAPAPVQRPRPKPIQSRPLVDQDQLQDVREAQTYSQRRQRPVAQTLRKWREENEDGSITWGYENDDGSFKEELIGTDCVTKGTYGYVDPDGNKREYHYETGIKCDPNTRETEEEEQENGFINYEENKAVLPNGIEIDMTQLGKKKSKRPGAILRN